MGYWAWRQYYDWVGPLVNRQLIGTLNQRLSEYDLRVTRFELSRPGVGGLRVSAMDIKSIGLDASPLTISTTDLSISPVEAFNFTDVRLKIAFLRIAVPATQANSPPLILSDLLQQLEAGLAFIPSSGVIDKLEICLPECQSGSLFWRRYGEAIEVYMMRPEAWVSIHLERGRVKMHGGMLVADQASEAALAQIELDITAKPLRFNGQLDYRNHDKPFSLLGRFPIDYDLKTGQASLSFMGSLNRSSTLEIEAVLDALNLEADIGLMVHWHLGIDSLDIAGQELMVLKLTHGSSGSRLTLDSDMTSRLTYPDLSAAKLRILPGATCIWISTLDCQIGEAQISALYQNIQLTSSITGLHLSDALDDPKLTFDLGVNITQKGELFDGDLGMVVTQAGLRGRSTRASLIQFVPLSFEFNHDFDTAEGQIAIDLTTGVESLVALLTRFEVDDITLNSGDITLDSKLVWRLARTSVGARQIEERPLYLASDTNLRLSRLSGDASGYKFQQAVIAGRMTGWPKLHSASPVKLTFKSFDIGVPLESGETQFDLEVDLNAFTFDLVGKRFAGNLLGGRVTSNQFEYNSLNQSGQIDIQLQGLALAQILQLERNDFESRGAISGSVPIQINGGKLSVTGGQVYALDPGGFIKYTPDAETRAVIASNQALKVVADIMADFQYDHLTSALDYTESGDLTAKTRLEGRNPHYENGRQINLNLNLEQNLKTLLESLRLSDQLTESIKTKAQTKNETENGVH